MKKNIILVTALFGSMILNDVSADLCGHFRIKNNPNAFYLPDVSVKRAAEINESLITIASRSSLKDSPWGYHPYSDFLIKFIENDKMFFQQSNADNLFMSSKVVNSLMLLFKENEEGSFYNFYDILTITPRQAERYESQNENEYNSYENLRDRFKATFAVIANFPAAHLFLFKKPLTNGEYNNLSNQINNMNYNDCENVYNAYMLSITKCFKLLFLMHGIQLPHKSSISDMITLLEDNWGEIESFAFNGNTSNWITRLKTNLIIQDNPKLLDRLVNYSRNLLHCMYSILIKFPAKYPSPGQTDFTTKMKEIMKQNLEETQFLSIIRFNMNENVDEDFFIHHCQSHNEYIDRLEYLNQIDINAPAENVPPVKEMSWCDWFFSFFGYNQ